VPLKAENQEIDLTEGSNAINVSLLNFYEEVKVKKHEAYKELEELIESVKAKFMEKKQKNKDRREAKKEKVVQKKEEGKF